MIPTNTLHDARPHFLANVLVRCAAVHRIMRQGRSNAHLGATTYTRLLMPPPDRQEGPRPLRSGGPAA